MTHIRTLLRQDVWAAIDGAPELAAFSKLRAEAFDRDPSVLPSITVATPRERVRNDAVDAVQRDVDVEVTVRKEGADTVEDELDSLSSVIERIVMLALEARADYRALTTTEMFIDGRGDKRIGNMRMTFRALAMTPEANPEI